MTVHWNTVCSGGISRTGTYSSTVLYPDIHLTVIDNTNTNLLLKRGAQVPVIEMFDTEPISNRYVIYPNPQG
jgi:hypothetical protein